MVYNKILILLLSYDCLDLGVESYRKCVQIVFYAMRKSIISIKHTKMKLKGMRKWLMFLFLLGGHAVQF